MSAYITQDYIKAFLSEPQIDALTSYGENVSGSLKLNMLISGSSSVIDSFLVPAGYDLPLSSVPDSIQKACCYLVINDLYASAQQPIPDTFSDQISQQYAYLNLLKDKKLILPGLSQNVETGTGASTFDFNVTGTDPARILDRKSLRGTFF